MLQRGQITEKTSSFLTTDIDRTQQLYLLPKIHKDMNNPPGRPIVSGSGGPTEKNLNLWTTSLVPWYHYQGHILGTPPI